MFGRTNNLGMTAKEEKQEAARIGRVVSEQIAARNNGEDDQDYEVVLPGRGGQTRMTRQR